MMEELALGDYFTILKRWKKVFFITAIAVFLVATVFALQWSNYRSTAVVQIESPQVASNVTLPNGTSQNDMAQAMADQRISQIQEKVLSTGSLVDVITKFDLYPSKRRHAPIASAADYMAKKIKVDLVSSAMANPNSDKGLSAIAFKLSFDYSNPLLTQQVTDELVTRFLDEDLKERRTETHETAAFLGDQITALEAAIADQEKKIADYEKQNGVTRPEALAFNQQAAQSATLSMQNLDSQIAVNEGNIGSIRAQLAGVDPYSRVLADGQVTTSPTVQLKALQAQYSTLSAQYGPDHPDVVKVRHQIEALQPQVGGSGTNVSAQLKSQISDVRTNLEAARKTYGPDHPDVVALQTQLSKLEDQLATQKVRAPQPEDGIVADADNPVYMQNSLQLRSAEQQQKALQEQRRELQAQLSSYQKAITQNPEVEQQMETLTRDHENAEQRYSELKAKKLAADMDEQLQQNRKGERLTLINPPQLPGGTTPPRNIMLLGGLVVSLLAGLTAVFVAQAIRQTIVGPRHLENIAGVPPLVCIPHILTSKEREQAMGHKTQLLLSGVTRRVGRS